MPAWRAVYPTASLSTPVGSKLCLWNGSSRVVRVQRIFIYTCGAGGSVSMYRVRINRVVGMTPSTNPVDAAQVVPLSPKSTSPLDPAIVVASFATNGTTVVDRVLRRVLWTGGRPVPGADTSTFILGNMFALDAFACVWDTTAGGVLQPIVLRKGQGIDLERDGGTGGDGATVVIDFTEEAT